MTARDIALRILIQWERKMERLEEALAEVVLPARERKFLHNLVSGVVRHRSLLDWKASKLYAGSYKKTLDKFKIILRLAIYELDYLDFIPPRATVNEYVNLAREHLPKALTSVVNGILRTYLREGKGLQPKKAFKYPETQIAVAYSFPEWLIKRWLHFWGEEETERLCETFNQRPEFDLRIHQNKIGYKAFITLLAQNKISFTPSSIFENVVTVTELQKLMHLNLFQRGFCSVQDESGQVTVACLDVKTGDVILDACAAPGGKFTLLKENISDQVTGVALEIDRGRLKKVRENCRRLGLSDNLLVCGDAKTIPLKKKFDKILVDAPCSGLGTIQKHPDIKWRRNFEEILQFQSLQLDILLSVEQVLNTNGIILYSTCTIDPSENEEVIAQFLQKSMCKFKVIAPPKRFKEMTTPDNYMRTWPHRHGMEGSFAAILQRTK